MLDPPPQVAETVSSASYETASPLVSVLVSTFRRPHYLDALVDTLEAQDADAATYEVVIVDNASQDDTWATLVRRATASPRAMRVARVVHNGGPATGRNAALALARGETVVFTDDDCLAEPQWVNAMLRVFADGATLVQGRTEPHDAGPRGMWDHTIAIRHATTLFETCNLGYRRADVIAAGGFAPLPGYRAGRGGVPFGGEDTVLGWKVVRATGASVTFAADAVVYHRIEPRDYRGWLKVRHGMGIFPALVANVPEMRDHLFLRVFFSSRSASFDLALVSLVGTVALRAPWPALGAAPYLAHIAPKRRNLRGWARRLVPLAVGDAAAAWSLVRGSIRQRRVVL